MFNCVSIYLFSIVISCIIFSKLWWKAGGLWFGTLLNLKMLDWPKFLEFGIYIVLELNGLNSFRLNTRVSKDAFDSWVISFLSIKLLSILCLRFLLFFSIIDRFSSCYVIPVKFDDVDLEISTKFSFWETTEYRF